MARTRRRGGVSDEGAAMTRVPARSRTSTAAAHHLRYRVRYTATEPTDEFSAMTAIVEAAATKGWTISPRPHLPSRQWQGGRSVHGRRGIAKKLLTVLEAAAGAQAERRRPTSCAKTWRWSATERRSAASLLGGGTSRWSMMSVLDGASPSRSLWPKM